MSFEDFKVFPNPVKDVIQINSLKTIDEINVYNNLGVKITQSFNTDRIDLSQFNAGLYFLEISLGNNRITKKIIKQ